jgi:heptosyltransferase-1
MKILVVRLSSLGDIVHLFPAISDLRRKFPDAAIHYLVEPAFAEMVGWHCAIDKVITVAIRRHKKNWWKLPGILRDLQRKLVAEKYDLVIDAQGLLKSALLSRMAGAPVYGFAADSARESLATGFYQKTASVAAGLHIVEKNRQLIAKLFDADILQTADYGLTAFTQRPIELPISLEAGCIVLLHGTTWNSKYWPELYWQELVRLLTEQGFRCLLPWGNEEEHQRAQRIAVVSAQILPQLSLADLTALLQQSRCFVSVETGIGHLATVLDIPGVMLHGPTDPDYSGITGKFCIHVTSNLPCSPCFKRNCPRLDVAGEIPPCQLAITPRMVFDECLKVIGDAE